MLLLTLLLVVIGLSIDQRAEDASQLRSDLGADRAKRAAYTDVVLRDLYAVRLPAALRSEIAQEHQRLLFEAMGTAGGETSVALSELSLLDSAILRATSAIAAPLADTEFDLDEYTRALTAEARDLLDVDTTVAATADRAEQEATQLRLVAIAVAIALALSSVDRFLRRSLRPRVALGSWLVLAGAGFIVVLR